MNKEIIQIWIGQNFMLIKGGMYMGLKRGIHRKFPKWNRRNLS